MMAVLLGAVPEPSDEHFELLAGVVYRTTQLSSLNLASNRTSSYVWTTLASAATIQATTTAPMVHSPHTV